MNPLALLHLLSAGFLAGVGSATFVFSLFVSAIPRGRTQGCFVRLIVLLCFIGAFYLMLEGLRLAA